MTIAKENDIFPQIVQAKSKPISIMGSPQPRPPLVSLFPLTLVQNKQAPPPSTPKRPHHPLPLPKLPFKVKTTSSPAALFSMFIKLWKAQKRYSWCLCYRSLVKEQVIASAAKIAGLSDEEQFLFLPSQHIVKGIAVSWERATVYYISLENNKPEAAQEIEARFVVSKQMHRVVSANYFVAIQMGRSKGGVINERIVEDIMGHEMPAQITAVS
jgi:hypothetical protein